MANVLTIDLGGTRIKSALFVGGEIVKDFVIPSNGSISKEAILESLDATFDNYANDDYSYIGISSAGRFNPATGVCVYASDNLKGWTGFHLKEYAEEKTGKKTFVDNDAVCALLSQVKKGDPDTLMLTLGTGVGACLFKDGHIYYGDNYDLGQLQHFRIRENGLLCDCSKRGCAEKELSKAGLACLIRKEYGEEKGVKELFADYMAGDERAKAVLDEYFSLFDSYCKMLIKAHPTIRRIIISGGIATDKVVFERYFSHIPQVTLSSFPGKAGLYGAYRMVMEGIGNGF